jgi:hypothetical protein
MQRQGKKPDIGRRYFSGTLAEMIMGYHMRPMLQAEQEKGKISLMYIDLCSPFECCE